MAKYVFFILIFILSSKVSTGQLRGPLLETFGPNEGLTGEVRDIVQGTMGHMYFASDQGLYQYDGNQFILHSHNPSDSTSIASGHLFKLIAGKDGLIWMTIHKNGLNSFDPQTGQFKRYPLPDHGLSKLTGGISLCEDEVGDIWVGSHHYRLYHLNRKSDTFEIFVPEWVDDKDAVLRRTDFSAIIHDHRDPDLFWLSPIHGSAPQLKNKSYGILCFNRKQQSFEWHPCNANLKFQDQNGVLWGTQWGAEIKSYDPNTQACDTRSFVDLFPGFESHNAPVTFDIIPLGDEYLMANKGIVRGSKDFVFDMLILEVEAKEYSSLYKDDQSNIWFGHSEGVKVLAAAKQHIQFYSFSELGVDYRLFPGRLAFVPDSDDILVTQTTPNGNFIATIPLSSDKTKSVKKANLKESPTGIVVDQNNNIWFQANGAIYLYNRHTQKALRQKESGMRNDSVPWLWNMQMNNSGWIGAVGTKEFLWFHPDEKKVREVVISDYLEGSENYIFNGFSFVTEEQALLFAQGKVLKVDLTNGQTTVLIYPEKLDDEIDLVQFAFRKKNGPLYINSYSTIYQLAENGDSLSLIDQFSINDGIVSPTISELHPDQYGRIWVFTNSGMDCLDPVTREIRHFGVKEGLPMTTIDPRQVIDVSNNRIATVCSNGIIVFHPDSLWRSLDQSRVPIVIQEVRVNGIAQKPFERQGQFNKYKLAKGPKVVDIKFQGIKYPTDRNVSYSYKYGDEWIDIGKNNFVSLPTLPYGISDFEVKTGIPSSAASIHKIQFIVPTPLYAQVWFLPLSILLGLTLSYFFYRYRINQIRNREQEKAETNRKLAELELIALRSQMNPHFMFNSLNSIKTYILEAKPDVAADYLSQFAHLIRRILQNSRERQVSLKEEIETLQLYISLEQFRFENAFEFVEEVDPLIDLNEVMIPPMLLQPYVENAIWHGLMHKKEGGRLKLIFERENGAVNCIIDDNGIGRDQAAELKSLSARKHKSLGMGITANRVQIINQIDASSISIEVIDKKDANGKSLGTKVIAQIPISTDDHL